MDVSIILVSYNTKDLTQDCIKSIYEKTQGINFEIFVVDNNSHDGSADMVEQEFPQVKLIRNTDNKGFGSANNIAIRQAQGKYVFCLNTDTLLINNAIKIMFDYMEKEENRNVGVCGGFLYDINQNLIHVGMKLPLPSDILLKFGYNKLFPKQYRKFLEGIDFDNNKSEYDIGYITGADIFFRKSVLDEVGLFDENIFMYFEETDLCKRIKNAGYKVKLLRDAKIIHLEGGSSKNELLKQKRFKKSELYYFKKHFSHQVFWVKIMYTILYLIDWIILRNNNSKQLLNFIFRDCKDE